MKLKRILSVICAFALALSLTMGFAQAKADGETKKAYVTIEKLTIGQGFVLEPTSVTLSEGDTVTTVFKKAANIAGLDYEADETYGFYLKNIKNVDTGVVNIPSVIVNMTPYEDTWSGNTYTAPNNDDNDGNIDSDLGEYDYNAMAGWMFTRNNLSVDDMSAEVEDGDVIRAQFSVFAWGGDIGIGWDAEHNLSVANRDALIKKVVDVQEDPDALAELDTEYTAAKNALSKYESTQDEVDAALSALNEKQTTTEETTTEEITTEAPVPTEDATTVEPTTEETTTVEPTTEEVTTEEATTDVTTTEEQTTIAPTTTQASTTNVPATTTKVPATTTKITVAKASIKSIKNIKKKKAKITVTPVAGATGYVFKYSKYKSFKKATRKETTKTFIKTKKFKKKQTCYAKVQAYKIVGEEKHFGQWSKVRKVKIKK